MGSKVIISADSGCDLFPDIYRERDIRIVPLYISMEGKSLIDRKEVMPEDLFRSVERTGKMPKTAAPAPADFFRLFRACTRQGYEVVHFSMNGKFSASYQNACLAAEEFHGVYVVDTCSASTGIGICVLRGADLRDEGASAKEIYRKILTDKRKVRSFVLLDTLDYVRLGGRATFLQSFGANLLRLRPCLSIDSDGGLHVTKKFRGNYAQVTKEYVRFVLDQPDISDRRLMFSYTSVEPEILEKSLEIIRESGKFREVLVTRAGCAMSCHVGPNTLALFYMEK